MTWSLDCNSAPLRTQNFELHGLMHRPMHVRAVLLVSACCDALSADCETLQTNARAGSICV
eukprot:6612306-Pyramimonas_sp.AAC.1